jgi:DNA-directed RNA polymerase subunit beta'
VIQPGNTGLEPKSLLLEDEYWRLIDDLGEQNTRLSNDDPNKFIALMGGEAIKELLKRVNPEETY